MSAAMLAQGTAPGSPVPVPTYLPVAGLPPGASVLLAFEKTKSSRPGSSLPTFSPLCLLASREEKAAARPVQLPCWGSTESRDCCAPRARSGFLEF